MRQENSVLIALRDLRAIESERLEEERRDEVARLATERTLTEQRQHEEQSRRRLDEQRAHELALRAADQALQAEIIRREAELRSELELEVRSLRAQAIHPVPPPRSEGRPLIAIGSIAAFLALAALGWGRLSPREHVVYLPAPPIAAPVPVAPIAAAAAPPVARPALTSASPRRPKPRVPRPPVPLPRIECDGKDPLCNIKGLD